MYVGQGDILTFDNGMVGTVTEKGRVALVSPQGWATPPRYQPLLTNYNAMYSIVRVEERHSQDAPTEVVWEDDKYCFRFKKYWNTLTAEERQLIDDEVVSAIEQACQPKSYGMAA